MAAIVSWALCSGCSWVSPGAFTSAEVAIMATHSDPAMAARPCWRTGMRRPVPQRAANSKSTAAKTHFSLSTSRQPWDGSARRGYGACDGWPGPGAPGTCAWVVDPAVPCLARSACDGVPLGTVIADVGRCAFALLAMWPASCRGLVGSTPATSKVSGCHLVLWASPNESTAVISSPVPSSRRGSKMPNGRAQYDTEPSPP
mmetsp:Transcript_1265/g.2563  ORF Transcript_1265/g.2563 Transcript_1265/m.2563 type:complete len:201 (-) Transcript_1265:86-688(-)